MAITIHQKAGLQINDETAISLEWLAELRAAGYARCEFLINARRPGLGELDPMRVKGVRAQGYVAWGVCWADSFDNPLACHQFLLGERRRIFEAAGVTFSGFIINAEDGTEARDQGGEKWSERFVKQYRDHPTTAKLALCLNTYIGCGGLNLKAWQYRGARLYVQTHHEGATFEWPMVAYKDWAAQYGWTALARLKPQWGVYSPRPSIQAQVADAKACGSDGFSAYYAEGAMPPDVQLIPLIQAARGAGVCH